MAQQKKPETREKTVIKSTGLVGMGECSSVALVDVKDGRIIRTRPLPYEWKYKREEFKPWQLEARGKVFKPPLKSLPVPFGYAYKKRVYSPNRILYPLKRVDWDPNGERNPQNRGKSKYVRISWDEAADIIVEELKRVTEQYGPEAILAQGPGHGEEKVVHGPHGCFIHLLRLLGGYTLELRNPDSWEGWYWGAKHVWGCEPVGLASDYQTNVYQDIATNTDAILFQGGDPETTPWGWGGHMISRLCYWFTELGIKQIYICPDLNYGAAVHADKWIPVKPNTDAALQLAIVYVWITENTYDKEYIATHTVGFDKLEQYVIGKEDGVAKTPRWAAEITGVPSRTIKALARYWASKTVTIAHGLGGPYIRGSYSHEPARLEVCLLAMQGLGRQGTHQISVVEMTFIASQQEGHIIHPPTPGGVVRPTAKRAYRGHYPFVPSPRQIIPKPLLYDAILNGRFSIFGSSYQMLPVEDQFKKYVYPIPGCSEIHMIWSDTPCFMTCWHGNTMAKAWQSPKIECIISEHPWLESDSIYADIILPVSTKYEEDDIGDDTISHLFDTLFLSKKCIEPLGESKSDYEIACFIAEKMGLLKEYTQGKSIEDWIKYGYETSGIKDMISWEEFKEKEYYVVPTDPNWKSYPAGMIEFYNDPAKHPLTTPTGKLEIYSQRLAEHFPDDDERPPVPHFIPYGETQQESQLHPRAKKYPLLCMSNHPRWRVHAQCDDINWFHEIVTCKVRGPDGYLYEPIWIHPTDAAKRGIKDGDVLRFERVLYGDEYTGH